MEIERALALLKDYLEEIPHLERLHYKNEEFVLWRRKVETVVKAAFPVPSEEYDWVHGAFGGSRTFGNEEIWQTEYLERLGRYRTALESIIQKYEIIGIPVAPEVGQVQPAQASISRYEATNPLYWIARLRRWQPIAVSVRWIRTRRGDVKTIMGLVFLLAAIVGILEYFS